MEFVGGSVSLMYLLIKPGILAFSLSQAYHVIFFFTLHILDSMRISASNHNKEDKYIIKIFFVDIEKLC